MHHPKQLTYPHLKQLNEKINYYMYRWELQWFDTLQKWGTQIKAPKQKAKVPQVQWASLKLTKDYYFTHFA